MWGRDSLDHPSRPNLYSGRGGGGGDDSCKISARSHSQDGPTDMQALQAKRLDHEFLSWDKTKPRLRRAKAQGSVTDYDSSNHCTLCVCVYIYIQTYTYLRRYIHTYIYADRHIHRNIHTSYKHKLPVFMCVYMYTNTYTQLINDRFRRCSAQVPSYLMLRLKGSVPRRALSTSLPTRCRKRWLPPDVDSPDFGPFGHRGLRRTWEDDL